MCQTVKISVLDDLDLLSHVKKRNDGVSEKEQKKIEPECLADRISYLFLLSFVAGGDHACGSRLDWHCK